MATFAALLRGINVGGKNKVPMAELKEVFCAAGCTQVTTYLNSGNVLFKADEAQHAALTEKLRAMLQERFGFDIPLLIIEAEQITDALDHAPAWWGTEDAAIYDNLIFALPHASAEQITAALGEPTEGLEQFFLYRDVIFWSFDRKRYAKANWWKRSAAPGIGELMTIRTAGTVRKLAEMSAKL